MCEFITNMVKVLTKNYAYIVFYKDSGTSNPVILGIYGIEGAAKKFKDAYVVQKYAPQTLPTNDVYIQKVEVK